ncbi:MAG: SDR family oxidoreductase [Saprospiraceae bacterium]|nr:SDR family oxidoreductase [Saprospiraceae bacterium]
MAIITGASSGIGEALARQMVFEGFDVVLAARNTDRLEEIALDLSKNTANILIVKTDVTNPTDCQNLIRETILRFRRVDVLINNAGISMRAMLRDLDLDVLHRVMDVNFWGAVYCTKYALPYILEQHGSIVGISSISGKHGLPGRTGYSASKFAMEGFLESLRIEHLPENLHVLVACPGFTATNIRVNALDGYGQPQGESPRDELQMMTADQVAKAIAWAIKHRKRDLILTAQGFGVFWLQKFFPSFVDRTIFRTMAKEPDSPFGKPQPDTVTSS